MKFLIIADDLTGANDSGAQLLHAGYFPSVLVNGTFPADNTAEAVVCNTNSRVNSDSEAYHKVAACLRKGLNYHPEIIYKKIDSTLRGNIGQELAALYDVVHPDFIIMNPAYPDNGRLVIDGELMVDDKKLMESHITNYPGPPFQTSNVEELLQQQAVLKTGYIKDVPSLVDLEETLTNLKNNDVKIIVFDAESDDQLKESARRFQTSTFNVAWAGSAGLMQHLSNLHSESRLIEKRTLNQGKNRILYVIGSVNERSRYQLQQLHQFSNVKILELDPSMLIFDKEKTKDDILSNIADMEDDQHLTITTKNEKVDWERLKSEAEKHNCEQSLIPELISDALGEMVKLIKEKQSFNWYFLTGGDAAMSVCSKNNWEVLNIEEELEPGIPIGTVISQPDVHIITKAGGFGSSGILLKVLEYTQGKVFHYEK